MQQRVFISSRLRELAEEREVVEKAVSELWHHERLPFTYWMWERAKEIPSGRHADKVQSDGVGDSNIFVLILGSEYGDFEYGNSKSHKEYATACSELEKDSVLIYIKDVETREEKLEKWIKELKNKHASKPFKNSDQLKDLVKTRLRDLWDARKWDANEVTILNSIRVQKQYYSNSGHLRYSEYFDADKLKVEIRGDDNSKSFIAFLVSLIFHTGEQDTTIYNIALTASNGDKKTTTIPDMIKLDGGKWGKFDIDEFTCKIGKNSTKRLFFRFISRDFLMEPEVLIELTLSHTSGDFKVVSTSKFIESIDDIKWAKGSSGGAGFMTAIGIQRTENR